MTYPPSSSGYPPSQQPTTQFSAPTQQFGKVEQPSRRRRPRRPPLVRASCRSSCSPPSRCSACSCTCSASGRSSRSSNTDFPQLGSASGTSLGLGLAVVASLLSALIAAASLLPKQKAPVGVIAAIAVLAFLLVIAEIIQQAGQASASAGRSTSSSVLTFLQAAVAIGALLLDAGIISAPVPKPKYEQQQQYGQYGAPEPVLRPARAAPGRAPAAASALPGPVRRLLGRIVVRWRLRRDRPAERPADPADRFPDLRPAAGVAVRADRPGSAQRSRSRRLRRTSPATRRRNPGLARVNPARASKELLYR